MRTLSMRIVTRCILKQRLTIENLNILANFRIGLIYAKRPPLKISCLGPFNGLKMTSVHCPLNDNELKCLKNVETLTGRYN
jgi:hypothetical protein